MRFTVFDLPQIATHLCDLDWENALSGDVALFLIDGLPIFNEFVENWAVPADVRKAAQRLKELIVAIPGIDLVRGLPETFDMTQMKLRAPAYFFGRSFERRREKDPAAFKGRVEKLKSEGPALIEVLSKGIQKLLEIQPAIRKAGQRGAGGPSAELSEAAQLASQAGLTTDSGHALLSRRPNGNATAGQQPQLPTRSSVAYQRYTRAIEKEPSLAAKSDAEVYKYIVSSCLESGEKIESEATFNRYLREARALLGEQKTSPRHGREGKSIRRHREL